MAVDGYCNVHVHLAVPKKLSVFKERKVQEFRKAVSILYYFGWEGVPELDIVVS